jgi:gamma-glutamylcyclotransferase (GGCT)/AIG2-like uncharacterized protein YtfP
LDEIMTCDQWYFAYGSNLFVDQKEERTGRIRRAVRCRLKGYRFAFNKKGSKGHVYANIVPDAQAEVWGVVYLCSPEALADMDRYEGVANGHYEQITVTVEKDSDESVQAITYVAGQDFVCEPSRPSEDYLDRIVSGARHHGLPQAYIELIEALASG